MYNTCKCTQGWIEPTQSINDLVIVNEYKRHDDFKDNVINS